MNEKMICRGDLFYYDFGDNSGSVQSGERPVLVVQADDYNPVSYTHLDVYKRQSEYLSDDCKGTCHDDDTGCFENNRNYGNSRNRHEYVPVSYTHLIFILNVLVI